MEERKTADLAEPRIVAAGPLTVAGLSVRYTFATVWGIPEQWRRLVSRVGEIPNQVGGPAYGLYRNFDPSGFEYVAGVGVSGLDALPEGVVGVHVPAQTYAVFDHRGPLSALGRSHEAIWNGWLPVSAYEMTGAPCFEKYDETFDPQAADGIVEIWIAVKPRGG